MYQKYNTILRAATGTSEFFTMRMKELCRSNRYVNTLHAINSCLSTLAALSECQYVYRGVSGAVLPDTFYTPSAVDKFRGGIELGFMSATTDRQVAT